MMGIKTFAADVYNTTVTGEDEDGGDGCRNCERNHNNGNVELSSGFYVVVDTEETENESNMGRG